MNSDKVLIGEIAFECLQLRDTQKILDRYEKIRKGFGENVVHSTRNFWRIALVSMLNAMAVKIYTLTGPASINDHEQISFEALYRRMGDTELQKFPYEEFESIRKKHSQIIKEWKKYRHNYAAHKKLKNNTTLDKLDLNIKKTEKLIQDLFDLSTKLWAGLFETGFPSDDQEGKGNNPQKHFEDLILLASKGMENQVFGDELKKEHKTKNFSF